VKIGFKNFKHFLHTKIGREKREKIVVVKDSKKNLNLTFLVFCLKKRSTGRIPKNDTISPAV